MRAMLSEFYAADSPFLLSLALVYLPRVSAVLGLVLMGKRLHAADGGSERLRKRGEGRGGYAKCFRGYVNKLASCGPPFEAPSELRTAHSSSERPLCTPPNL